MPQLREGDKAPDFQAFDQQGNKVSLKDFKGKKIVLYFYPKDDTPSCTKEACNLRDNYSKLKKMGFEVIGVSTDDVKSHSKFAKKFNLPFTLIADPEKLIVEKYGVYGEKKLFGVKFMGTKRTTFIIDENGIIEKIISNVKTAEHANQILN